MKAKHFLGQSKFFSLHEKKRVIDLSLNERVFPVEDVRFLDWEIMLVFWHVNILASFVYRTNPTGKIPGTLKLKGRLSLLVSEKPETFVVAGLETSTKDMTVLQIAAIDKSVSNDNVDVVTNDVSVTNQECLLPSSHEGSCALERFLYDKQDPLSREVLETIAAVDPSGVLAFLDENGTDRHVGGNEAVLKDEGLASGDVNRVLESELQQCSRNSIVVLGVACQLELLWKCWVALFRQHYV